MRRYLRPVLWGVFLGLAPETFYSYGQEALFLGRAVVEQYALIVFGAALPITAAFVLRSR